jgi:hypothetical protein
MNGYLSDQFNDMILDLVGTKITGEEAEQLTAELLRLLETWFVEELYS